jgi:hypothetical protein
MMFCFGLKATALHFPRTRVCCARPTSMRAPTTTTTTKTTRTRTNPGGRRVVAVERRDAVQLGRRRRRAVAAVCVPLRRPSGRPRAVRGRRRRRVVLAVRAVQVCRALRGALVRQPHPPRARPQALVGAVGHHPRLPGRLVHRVPGAVARLLWERAGVGRGEEQVGLGHADAVVSGAPPAAELPTRTQA